MKNIKNIIALSLIAGSLVGCNKSSVDVRELINSLQKEKDYEIMTLESIATVKYSFEDLFNNRLSTYGGDFSKVETSEIKKYDNKVVDTYNVCTLTEGETQTVTNSHIQTWVEDDGSLWYGEEDDTEHDSYQLMTSEQWGEYESAGYGWDVQTKLGENQYAIYQLEHYDVEANKETFYIEGTENEDGSISGKFGYESTTKISKEGLGMTFTYDVNIKVVHEFTFTIKDGITTSDAFIEKHYALSDPVEGTRLTTPIEVYSNILENTLLSTESNGRFFGKHIRPKEAGVVQVTELGDNTVEVLDIDIDYRDYEYIGKMCSFTAPQDGTYEFTCADNNVCFYHYDRKIAILAGGYYAKSNKDEAYWHTCKKTLSAGQTWTYSVAGSSVYDSPNPDGTGTYTFNIKLLEE